MHTLWPKSQLSQVQNLADFVVGVIDDLPDLESYLLPEHTICGHYDGAVSEGASVDVTCNTNAHGRYLMVYIELELAQIDFWWLYIWPV